MQSIIQSDVFVAGNLSSRTFSAPEGSITNNAIAGSAAIDFTKIIHKLPIRYAQKAGTAIVTETVLAHIAAGNGTIVAVEVVCITPPTTTDTITIDVKKGNAATSYATILTGVITLDNASVTRTVYNGTTSTGTYLDGDSFEIVVTATGTSAQGLAVVLWLGEAAA